MVRRLIRSPWICELWRMGIRHVVEVHAAKVAIALIHSHSHGESWTEGLCNVGDQRCGECFDFDRCMTGVVDLAIESEGQEGEKG